MQYLHVGHKSWLNVQYIDLRLLSYFVYHALANVSIV
jgi:hypothetical protein